MKIISQKHLYVNTYETSYFLSVCLPVNRPGESWLITCSSILHSIAYAASVFTSVPRTLVLIKVNSAYWNAEEYRLIQKSLDELFCSFTSTLEFRVVSSSDTGLYDAWNTCVSETFGCSRYILFLGAGDCLHRHHIASFIAASNDESSNVIYVTNTLILDLHGRELLRSNANPLLLGNSPCASGFFFPGTIFPAKIFTSLRFDTSYAIAADYKLLLETLLHDCRFVGINVFTYFTAGGVSNRNVMKVYLEALRAWSEYIAPSPISLYARAKVFLLFLRNSFFAWRLRRICKSLAVQFLTKARQFLFSSLLFNSHRTALLRLIGHEVNSTAYIHRSTKIIGFGKLTIGHNTIIGPSVHLDIRGNINLGNNISVSRDTRILTGSHNIQSPFFEFVSKDVHVDSYSCLFTGCTILPGSHIGACAIISAGEIASGDVPNNSILKQRSLAVLNRPKPAYSIDTSFIVPKD
jgi:acetyltransferase-like isoleucine patch superfamily enzyme